MRRESFFFITCAAVLIFVTMCMGGCSSSEPGKTSANIGKGLQALQHQQGTLNEVGATVGAMTPANVESQKPKASALIADAKGDNATAQKALTTAASSAKALEKKVAESKDPTTVRLQWAGFIFIACGIAAFVIGVFSGNPTTTYDNYLRSGGVAFFVIGVSFLAIAKYITIIILGCVVAGLVGIVVWAYLHRADILPWLPLSALRRNGVGQAVPAPVVAQTGQVTSTAAAVGG